MIDITKDNLLSEVLIGLTVAVLLALLMGIEFYNWAVEEFLSYAFSVFFIMPIALTIIERKLPKEYFILGSIGAICLVIYTVILGKTLEEISINILQTIVVITLLSLFFSILKRMIESKTPWNWRR